MSAYLLIPSLAKIQMQRQTTENKTYMKITPKCQTINIEVSMPVTIYSLSVSKQNHVLSFLMQKKEQFVFLSD